MGVVKDMPNYNEVPYTETDGQGIVSLQAYKQLRVRSSDWTEADEAQYQYDMKYENIVKSNDSKEEIERNETEKLKDIKGIGTKTVQDIKSSMNTCIKINNIKRAIFFNKLLICFQLFAF